MSDPHPNDKYDDAMLVSRYLEIRDFIEREETAQSEYLKPSRDSMETIAGELHRRLIERQGGNPEKRVSGSAGGGTFFLKRLTSIRIVDRNAWFDFVHANWEWAKQKALTAHVVKDGIEEYLELETNANRDPPPGVTVEVIRKLEVRKT